MPNPNQPFAAGGEWNLSDTDAQALEAEAQRMVTAGEAQDAKRARQMIGAAYQPGMTVEQVAAAVAAEGGPRGFTGRPADKGLPPGQAKREAREPNRGQAKKTDR